MITTHSSQIGCKEYQSSDLKVLKKTLTSFSKELFAVMRNCGLDREVDESDMDGGKSSALKARIKLLAPETAETLIGNVIATINDYQETSHKRASLEVERDAVSSYMKEIRKAVNKDEKDQSIGKMKAFYLNNKGYADSGVAPLPELTEERISRVSKAISRKEYKQVESEMQMGWKVRLNVLKQQLKSIHKKITNPLIS